MMAREISSIWTVASYKRHIPVGVDAKHFSAMILDRCNVGMHDLRDFKRNTCIGGWNLRCFLLRLQLPGYVYIAKMLYRSLQRLKDERNYVWQFIE